MYCSPSHTEPREDEPPTIRGARTFDKKNGLGNLIPKFETYKLLHELATQLEESCPLKSFPVLQLKLIEQCCEETTQLDESHPPKSLSLIQLNPEWDFTALLGSSNTND